jgi:hypothetical protein
LPAPTDDGRTITSAALELWDAVRRGKTVRLIGVAVSGIDAGPAQLALFEGAETRRAALNQALDALVARFGTDAIVRGGVK